jgi:hypothetical protein
MRGESLSQATLQDPRDIADPYTTLGSHPEIVERLWDAVGSQLTTDCRAVVCGTPALVAPRSGIVFGLALGTEYALRLTAEFLIQAREAGAEVIHHYQTTGDILNLRREFGPDWVFGKWDGREPQWCSATLASAEMAA